MVGLLDYDYYEYLIGNTSLNEIDSGAFMFWCPDEMNSNCVFILTPKGFYPVWKVLKVQRGERYSVLV